MSYPYRVREFFERNERHISTLFLVGGFIFDTLTLRRIDVLWDNALIILYLMLTAVGIVVLHLHRGEILRHRLIGLIHDYIPLAMQFAFGGLFSVFSVFYFRSASWATSWPFLLILFGLLIGNEFFREYYEQLAFQVSIFFVALFSYLVFAIPILVGQMGTLVFLASGVCALLAILLFINVLAKALPNRVEKSRRALLISVGVFYTLITTLYFTNTIPPVPLSLKEAGVYHAVSRSVTGYDLVGEMRPWYTFLKKETIHILPGSPVFLYSAVFAPTRLATDIVHEWQYKDVITGKWISVAQVPFAINGGRDGGYRGYSFKTSLSAGKWRVNVETSRGQVIGRVTFFVEYSSNVPPLITQKR